MVVYNFTAIFCLPSCSERWTRLWCSLCKHRFKGLSTLATIG